ncbi:MAG: indolepyruvate oxidoreductase subunit beta [Deltaproteobacteria bacterium]|nr:indolepyruvate oxidoreductase subunit beta [Deltaproteobacteria bacterium]
MKTVNILLSGVGGQGVILASKILSQAALLQGLDIKQSEVHGMSQRGGSVVSHVRIGDVVHSPLVPEGGCDILVGFEPLEALRYAHWVRPEGTIIYSVDRINPSTVSAGFAEYPEDIGQRLGRFPCTSFAVAAGDLAEQAGNRRSANVVLVGTLADRLFFPEEIWEKALEASVPPKLLPLNREAFRLGRGAGQG